MLRWVLTAAILLLAINDAEACRRCGHRCHHDNFDFFAVRTLYPVPVAYPEYVRFAQPLAAPTAAVWGPVYQQQTSCHSAGYAAASAGCPPCPPAEKSKAQASRWVAKQDISANLLKGRTILRETCVSCHNPKDRKGGLSFYKDKDNWNEINWEKVYARVSTSGAGRMPPSGPLTPQAIATIDALRHGDASSVYVAGEASEESVESAGSHPSGLSDDQLAMLIEKVVAAVEKRRAGENPKSEDSFNIAKAYCGQCHTEGGDANPVLFNADGVFGVDCKTAGSIRTVLKFRAMPPKDCPMPTKAEASLIADFFDQVAQATEQIMRSPPPPLPNDPADSPVDDPEADEPAEGVSPDDFIFEPSESE